MVIEVKEKGSREFYEEVVNVVAQYGRLRKKPEAKLKNYFVSADITVFILAVTISHKQEILGYLKENEVKVKVIE